ncbi:MAG: tol-pal system-associated acyl-CoA thioesterase [Betaproteobacteria bacterium]|nr:tol-pal system-associated acyl-CoA thioesterase [Betaproteobacteria bacterium]
MTAARNPGAAAFTWPIRVYYEDTDSGGVVYYANYLRFLERARTEWLRARGFEQAALAAEHKVAFVVRSLSVEYLQPARFDDVLELTVEPLEIGASVIMLAQRALRRGEELVTARMRIACVNTASFRPVRIPKAVMEKIGNHT